MLLLWLTYWGPIKNFFWKRKYTDKYKFKKITELGELYSFLQLKYLWF